MFLTSLFDTLFATKVPVNEPKNVQLLNRKNIIQIKNNTETLAQI